MNNYFDLTEGEKKLLRMNIFLAMYSADVCRVIKSKKGVERILLHYLKTIQGQALKMEDYYTLACIRDLIYNKEYELDNYGL